MQSESLHLDFVLLKYEKEISILKNENSEKGGVEAIEK